MLYAPSLQCSGLHQRSASHGPSAHSQGLGKQSLLPLLHESSSGQDLKHNQVRAMTCPAVTAGRCFPGCSDIKCDTPGCDRNPWKAASRRSAVGTRRRAALVLRSSQRCTQFSLFNKPYRDHTDSLSLA